MDNNKHSILIISYRFPPIGGIGERRVTKFTKYLVRAGFKVHVVTIKSRLRVSNSWVSDIEGLGSGLVIHRLPSYSPFYLYYFPFKNNFKLQLRRVARFLIRFIWGIDLAQFWGKRMIPYCVNLIKHENIKNIIATGAPFTINHHATKIKDALQGINLINDFRDPWIDKGMYWFTLPVFKRKAAKIEKAIINHGDIITSVNPTMIELLKAKCSNPETRFRVLTNGFDEEDRISIEVDDKAKSFTLLHAGNFSGGGEISLKTFFAGLCKAIAVNPGMKNDLKVVFVGNSPFKHLDKGLEEKLKKIIIYKGFVAPQRVFLEMKNSFLSLIINSPGYSHAIVTKIYESLSMRVPVLGIMPEGEGSNFIVQNKIGTAVKWDDTEGVKTELLRWYKIWQENPEYKPGLSNNDINSYSYKFIVSKLIECFI